MLLYILSRLDSIIRGLASAKAWHSILYLATPLQYLQRLGILFYILLCLGSICKGLAFYSIFFYALQYLPRLGMLFYLITPWQYWPRLGILACFFFNHTLAVSAKAWHSIESILCLLTPLQYLQKDQPPKIQATKAQVETETPIQDCKRPGSKNQSYESSS